MRTHAATAGRAILGLLAALVTISFTLSMGTTGAEAAPTGVAMAALPGLVGMSWLVGLAIFPPAALLALTFLVAVLTDRMA